MDSVMEKYSAADFFNQILIGFVSIVGIGIVDKDIALHMDWLLGLGSQSTFAAILLIAVLLVIALVCGMIVGILGNLIEKKVFKFQERLVNKCLTDPAVVGNVEKYTIYRDSAQNFFESKRISIKDNFSMEQCSCFFAHCVYYAQVRDKNNKTERLRDVQNLSNGMMVSFALLTFWGLGVALWYVATDICSLWPLIVAFISLIFTMLFGFKYRLDVQNRIRMVLAVYSACEEMELKK